MNAHQTRVRERANRAAARRRAELDIAPPPSNWTLEMEKRVNAINTRVQAEVEKLIEAGVSITTQLDIDGIPTIDLFGKAELGGLVGQEEPRAGDGNHYRVDEAFMPLRSKRGKLIAKKVTHSKLVPE